MTFDESFAEFVKKDLHASDAEDLADHALILRSHAKVIDDGNGNLSRFSEPDVFQFRRTRQIYEAGWNAREKAMKAAT